MLDENWHPKDASFYFSRESTRNTVQNIINQDKKEYIKEKRENRGFFLRHKKLTEESPTKIIFQKFSKESFDWRKLDLNEFNFYIFLFCEKDDLDNFSDYLEIFFSEFEKYLLESKDKFENFEIISLFENLGKVQKYVPTNFYKTLSKIFIEKSENIYGAWSLDLILNFLNNSPEVVDEIVIRFIAKNFFQIEYLEWIGFLNIINYLLKSRDVYKIVFLNEIIDLDKKKKLKVNQKTFSWVMWLLERLDSYNIPNKTLNWLFKIIENIEPEITWESAAKILLWLSKVGKHRIPEEIFEIIFTKLEENILDFKDAEFVKMIFSAKNMPQLYWNKRFIKIFFNALENNYSSINILTAKNILIFFKYLPKNLIISESIENNLFEIIEKTDIEAFIEQEKINYQNMIIKGKSHSKAELEKELKNLYLFYKRKMPENLINQFSGKNINNEEKILAVS